MKIATQHYQDSVITPYGNNHWNGKEKIDISKEKDDAVILEISAKGKRAIQLKEKNEFEQNIVQVDKSADDLPAYSGMYDVDKTISSSLENCSKEEQGFVYDIIRENFLIGNGSSAIQVLCPLKWLLCNSHTCRPYQLKVPFRHRFCLFSESTAF